MGQQCSTCNCNKDEILHEVSIDGKAYQSGSNHGGNKIIDHSFNG